jgi:hypothetical protein
MGVANFQLIAALRALEEIPFLYLIRDDLGTVVEGQERHTSYRNLALHL